MSARCVAWFVRRILSFGTVEYILFAETTSQQPRAAPPGRTGGQAAGDGDLRGKVWRMDGLSGHRCLQCFCLGEQNGGLGIAGTAIVEEMLCGNRAGFRALREPATGGEMFIYDHQR